MNKFITKVAKLVLGLSLAAGVGVAVGSQSKASRVDASSYTLNFEKGTGDGSALTTSTDASAVLNSGTAYVTSKPFSGVSNSYGGGTALKVGKSGSGGSVTIALASAVTPTSVVVNAARYNGNKTTTINVNSAGSQSVTSTTASDFTFNITSEISSLTIASTSNYCWVYSVTINYSGGTTALTGLSLSGTDIEGPTAGVYALSIGSSDLTNHTINVGLTPQGATDQKVNIAHQGGTNDLFTKSAAQITCTNGSGSFTLTGSGATSGSETFRISGNTETSVYVDIIVTATDDSGISKDVITASDLAATTNSYVAFEVAKTATYIGYSGKSSTNMQFNNNGTPTNRCIATSVSGGLIRKVSVTYGNANNNTMAVKVSNTAYSISSSFNSGTTAGTLSSSNTTVNITGDYAYVALFPSGATYPASVSFTWETNDDPSVEISSSPAYLTDGGSASTLSATITNDNNYTISWSASPSTGVTFSPSTSSSGGDVSVSFDGTTTGTTPIEITATLDDENTTASAPVKVYSLEHAGTSADPFSPTDADVFCNENYAAQSGGDWYVEGYVVGELANNKGYYIDEDPTATSSPYKFEVYNTNGISNTTGKTITVGTSKIIAHGAMSYYDYGSQSEITGAIITSVDNGTVPSIGIDGGNRIVDINDTVTLTVTKEYDEGALVTWTSSEPTVATVSNGALTLLSTGSTDITASMTVDAVVYSSTITVTVVRQAFSLGDEVYFYTEYNDTTYYMCAVGGTNSSSTTESEKIVFTVVAGSVSGSVAFKHGDDYLKCTGSTPYSGSSTTLDVDTSWTALDEGTHIEITTCGSQTGRKLLWNYNNGSPRFGCYGSTSATMLYVEAGVAAKPTSVTLSEHAVTLENGSTIHLTYTSDNSGTFIWTTSSNDVATVSNGEVECVADSGTSTIRIFYDSNGNGSYDNGEPTDTCVITATPAQVHFGDDNYGGIGTLIESDSNLNGKKVIIGRNAVPAVNGSLSGSVLEALNNDSEIGGVSYNSTTKKMTVGNGRIKTGVLVFTITSVTGGYTLSTTIGGQTKFLRENSAKNVGLGETQTWEISISSGTATITSTNGNDLQYNASSPRFTTYTSSQSSIELYEFKSYYEEATDYAEYFVGGSTGTCSETISDWDDLGDMFDLMSTGAQNIYKIATHLDPSTYSHEVSVEHAVARYDDALLKHTELRSNEFMGRVAEGTLSYSNPKVALVSIISESTNTVAFIVVISLVSVTTIGGYFFLKKRREQQN